MKSDNRGLFDVFKKGERDDLSFWGKLKYWFTNVYWCNYKGLTFLALFGIVCAIVFVVNLVNREQYDLGYIMAGDVVIESEKREALEKFMVENISDANEDGEKKVNGTALIILNGEDRDQMSIDSDEKFNVSFADDEVLLYIMDRVHMESYVTQGAFEPLATFGIKTDEKYCIEITDAPILDKLGIPKATDGWFVGLKVIADGRGDDEEIMKKYEAGAEVIKAFLKK